MCTFAANTLKKCLSQDKANIFQLYDFSAEYGFYIGGGAAGPETVRGKRPARHRAHRAETRGDLYCPTFCVPSILRILRVTMKSLK